MPTIFGDGKFGFFYIIPYPYQMRRELYECI